MSARWTLIVLSDIKKHFKKENKFICINVLILFLKYKCREVFNEFFCGLYFLLTHTLKTNLYTF